METNTPKNKKTSYPKVGPERRQMIYAKAGDPDMYSSSTEVSQTSVWRDYGFEIKNQSCGLSRSFLLGVRVGSLAKKPNRKTPTKKKTTVYTEIFRASMESYHVYRTKHILWGLALNEPWKRPSLRIDWFGLKCFDLVQAS